jgi:hypothetical protein
MGCLVQLVRQAVPVQWVRQDHQDKLSPLAVKLYQVQPDHKEVQEFQEQQVRKEYLEQA